MAQHHEQYTARLQAIFPFYYFSLDWLYNQAMPKSDNNANSVGYSGSYLSQLRKAAGLSQRALAKRLGVPQSNIAFWEHSSLPPRSDLLPLLANILSVSVEHLLSPLPAQAQPTIPKPIGKIQRLCDRIALLPRHQQDKLADLFSFVIESFELNISSTSSVSNSNSDSDSDSDLDL